MRSVIRDMVLALGVFFPMVIFCLAISTQFRREHSKKPSIKIVTGAEPGNSTALVRVKKSEEVSYLLFEQLTR